MPDLSPTRDPLRFVPDQAKLYPKFESYRLHPYSEDENVNRIALPIAPSRPVLPTNARVGFQDVRVRTGWNHLSQGWEGKSVLYIGEGGEIVRIQGERSNVAGRIPLLSREDVYGFFPRAIEIAPECFMATDGLGGLFLVRDGSVVASVQEYIPFLLFDAKVVDGQAYVLSCQGTSSVERPSTSHHSKGEYTLRKLRLSISSTLQYTVDIELVGTEIPQHAILTPDILLVARSPFRKSAVASELEDMTIDDITHTLPLYTYYQTLTNLEISIPLPASTPKSSIDLKLSNSALQLRFLPPQNPNQPDLTETFPFQTIDEQPLWGPIDPVNSTWTLSSSSPSAMVLDIHLEKLPDEQSRWPQVFKEPDGAEEYIDPSDRRTILDRLEKYHESTRPSDPDADAIRRRFLMEEDDDIDSDYKGDLVQLFPASTVHQLPGHDLLALPFGDNTLGLKVSIDMCVFDVAHGHKRTFPAFGFVASSKRLRKYCRYTEGVAIIVESGRGGNLYAYYEPGDGLIGKQVVVRLGVESIGIGFVEGMGVVILGERDGGVDAVVVGDL